MRPLSFKKASIISFFIVICIAYILFITERFLAIRSNELEKIRLFGLPSTQTLARSIEIRLNERLRFFQNIASEIENSEITDQNNQTTIDEICARNKETLVAMGLLDSHGTALFYSPSIDPEGKSNIGKNFSDREYFIASKDKNTSVIGHALKGRGTQRYAIPLLIPLKKGNETEGYLLAALDLVVARELTESFRTEKMMRVTLVDDKGTVLSKPGVENIEAQMQNFSELPIFTDAQKQDSGLSYYTSLVDGRKKLGAYSKLNNGWVVWISYDLGEMDAEIVSTLWGFLLISFVFFGVSIFLIVSISNLMTTPILNITRAAEKVTENGGDTDLLDDHQKKIAARFKETELLSTSLQEMLNKLNDYNRHLDKMVKDRTRQLHEANVRLRVKTQ